MYYFNDEPSVKTHKQCSNCSAIFESNNPKHTCCRDCHRQSVPHVIKHTPMPAAVSQAKRCEFCGTNNVELVGMYAPTCQSCSDHLKQFLNGDLPIDQVFVGYYIEAIFIINYVIHEFYRESRNETRVETVKFQMSKFFNKNDFDSNDMVHGFKRKCIDRYPVTPRGESGGSYTITNCEYTLYSARLVKNDLSVKGMLFGN